MDSMSLRYLYDVESISLRHRNDIIVTIWIRHRIHIVAMLNLYRNDNAIAISLPYGFDIEMITISTSNPYRCDIKSISLRCRIHIDNVTIRIQCRYDMDSMSNPY